MLRHVFTAGLLALGLMFSLFAAHYLMPFFVWTAALYPGMLLAQGLFFVLPDEAIGRMIDDGDDAPAVFASMSVVIAFLFWWMCALVLVKLKARWLAKRVWT